MINIPGHNSLNMHIVLNCNGLLIYNDIYLVLFRFLIGDVKMRGIYFIFIIEVMEIRRYNMEA